MAIKAISQFDAATPTSNDKILFEQNGDGKSTTIGNAVNTCSLTLEEIQATTDLTGKVASANALKDLNSRGVYKIYTADTVQTGNAVFPKVAYLSLPASIKPSIAALPSSLFSAVNALLLLASPPAVAEPA